MREVQNIRTCHPSTLKGPSACANPSSRAEVSEETVSVDFTKWIDAEDDIPRVFVFDHGRQFDNIPLRNYTNQFGIKLAYLVVCHPESNRQAEDANKQILGSLKKKVEDQKSIWLDELVEALWALRTTKKEATVHTLFNLVYGSEAVLSMEIGTAGLRIHAFSKDNKQLQRESLDFLDKTWDSAQQKIAIYKQRISNYYSRKVNAPPLKIGDLVFRNAAAVWKSKIHAKLSVNWEGLYEIYDEIQLSTYKLR